MAGIMMLSCCGIREITGITYGQTPRQVLTDINKDFRAAFAIFSDNRGTDFRAGTALAAEIEKYGLGTVTCGGHKVNPNTGNSLKVWLWRVNRDALSQYCAGKGKVKTERRYRRYTDGTFMDSNGRMRDADGRFARL